MNIAALKDAIKYGPRKPICPPKGLLGWWHSDASGDIWVCAECASRIMGRGVSIQPCAPVYDDSLEPSGRCVTCDPMPHDTYGH